MDTNQQQNATEEAFENLDVSGVSELTIVACFVAIFALILLVKVYSTFRPIERSEWESTLDDMINGYDLSLPEEVQAYELLKTKLFAGQVLEMEAADDEDGEEDEEPAPLDPKKLHPNELKEICAALFKRALADIPLAGKLQSDSAGMSRLKRSDILRDAAFDSFKGAESVIEKEIKRVQKEAQFLKPELNWGKSIFSQASQLYSQMKSKNRLIEKEKRDVADAKRLVQQKKDMEEAELLRTEKKRAKAIKDLIEQENGNEKKDSSSPVVGSKKKN